MPKLVFPGGALIGCAAGFMNVARIKGSHNAIWSAVLAAEHSVTALAAARAHDELISYEMGWRGSVIGRDLRKVRNLTPLWSKLGTVVGTALGALDIWTNTFGFSLFGTLHHGNPNRVGERGCRRENFLAPANRQGSQVSAGAKSAIPRLRDKELLPRATQ